VASARWYPSRYRRWSYFGLALWWTIWTTAVAYECFSDNWLPGKLINGLLLALLAWTTWQRIRLLWLPAIEVARQEITSRSPGSTNRIPLGGVRGIRLHPYDSRGSLQVVSLIRGDGTTETAKGSIDVRGTGAFRVKAMDLAIALHVPIEIAAPGGYTVAPGDQVAFDLWRDDRLNLKEANLALFSINMVGRYALGLVLLVPSLLNLGGNVFPWLLALWVCAVIGQSVITPKVAGQY
jgi:hypothetical protein